MMNTMEALIIAFENAFLMFACFGDLSSRQISKFDRLKLIFFLACVLLSNELRVQVPWLWQLLLLVIASLFFSIGVITTPKQFMALVAAISVEIASMLLLGEEFPSVILILVLAMAVVSLYGLRLKKKRRLTE
jgi:hypothetical protein